MKRILVVSQHFYPENFRFNDLVFDLAKDSKVTVITAIPNYPEGSFYPGYKFLSPQIEIVKGVKIVRVPIIPRGQSRLMLALNYLSFMVMGSIYGFIFGLFRKYDQVLVCQTSPIFMAFPAITYKFLRKSPVCLWVTDLWPESLIATKTIKNQSALMVLDLVVGWIYKHVDLVLMSCKGFEQSIKAKFPGARTAYFPYWAEDFYVITLPDPKFEFSNRFKLMFAGNIGTAQNIEMLASAVSKLKNSSELEVIIVGDGRGRQALEQAINKHGVGGYFTFIGSFPPEEMPGLFAHADALYLSLRKDPIFEITVPSKLQSYMACGKPILASIDGEAAEIIRGAECGFVVDAEDEERLVDALLSVMALNKAELQVLGDNSQKYYKQYFNREKSMRDIRHFLGV